LSAGVHEVRVLVRRVTRLSDNTELTVAGHGYDVEREFYIIELDREFSVQPGNADYRLDISFQSAFNDQLRGLYYR